MDTQLTYLAWSAFLCIVLWVPYVLERVQLQGLTGALGYPENPPEPAAWALPLSNYVKLSITPALSP